MTGSRLTELAVRRMIESSVPCGACQACCRNGDTIAMQPEDAERLARIPPALLRDVADLLSGRQTQALRHQADGSCAALAESGCSIYKDRPAICRAFDCRVVVRAMSRAERRRLGRDPRVAEILEAGRARLGTLQG